MRRLVCVFAVFACRGDGRSAAPPGDPVTPPPAPGAPVADSDRPRPRPHPVTPAVLDALAATAVPGHDVRVIARGATDLALAITAPPPAPARATLSASACLGCVAPDLEAWRARRAELAALWAPGADADPPAAGTHLAIDALDLGGGARAIAVDARRADGSAVTVAHWNDGALQLQVVCELPAEVCAPIVRVALTSALAALPEP